jgi:hypothetical protein
VLNAPHVSDTQAGDGGTIDPADCGFKIVRWVCRPLSKIKRPSLSVSYRGSELISKENPMSDGGDKTSWKTFVEEVEVSGKHLLDEINRLMAEGNVRKLVVKSGDGDVFLSLPLTAGAVAGGILTLGAPWLAILVAVAGLLAKVRVEITREAAPPPETSANADKTPPNPPGTQS